MRISNNYTNYNKPSFGAKFFHSESLKNLVEYSVEHGKFDRINQARKSIDNAYLTTRLRMDISTNDSNNPIVIFTRYKLKNDVIVPTSMDDYKVDKTIEFVSAGTENPLKYALNKLIKLGNGAPNNNMYKDVVIK
jgi:hypothetical protein